MGPSLRPFWEVKDARFSRCCRRRRRRRSRLLRAPPLPTPRARRCWRAPRRARSSIRARLSRPRPRSRTNFKDTEVEPLVAVNPNQTDRPNNVIGVYQEDRWSDGGAHGLLAATSFDGGASLGRPQLGRVQRVLDRRPHGQAGGASAARHGPVGLVRLGGTRLPDRPARSWTAA